MLARAALDADRCRGCGGYLSETTKNDHGTHIEVAVCFDCKARQADAKSKAKQDEDMAKVPEAQRDEVGYIGPEGRLITSWPIPLPPPEPDDE